MKSNLGRVPWKSSELTYCSNVHPAENYHDLKSVVTSFTSKVRQKRGLNFMGAGLWINNQVAMELVDQTEKLRELNILLKSNHIDLFTLNGFPYGNFHAHSVKEAVYTPDWSQPQRLHYTQQLAEILSYCLPSDIAEGTISTLPLGFRHTWTPQKQEASLLVLCELAVFLESLQRRSGRTIRVCLEMEPDCVLETTDELIHFFQTELPAKASALGITAQTLRNHLGVCFDVCHQAVMFEDVSDSLARITAASITIGKIQISSALAIAQPDSKETRLKLAEFAEQKYLHQVRTLVDNRLVGVLDLPIALAEKGFTESNSWRIHFHVPIQTATLALEELGTTQSAILEVLDFLKNNPLQRPHLEIETYTWQVLPKTLRPQNDKDLIKGLTDELDWLDTEMSLRGLIQ